MDIAKVIEEKVKAHFACRKVKSFATNAAEKEEGLKKIARRLPIRWAAKAHLELGQSYVVSGRFQEAMELCDEVDRALASKEVSDRPNVCKYFPRCCEPTRSSSRDSTSLQKKKFGGA